MARQEAGNARASPRLQREKIVRTAIGLLDEVGLDALTTRLLAGRLGVRQPALYWHFKNRQELVDAMAEAVLDEADWPGPPAPGADPRAWLAARAHAFRRALLAHRDGARLHAGTWPSADQLTSIESQVDALTSAGLSPVDAGRAALALSRYTVGWVLEEQARQYRVGQPGPGLAEQAVPALDAMREARDGGDPTADFDFGVRAMLAGLPVRSQAGSASEISKAKPTVLQRVCSCRITRRPGRPARTRAGQRTHARSAG